jgi:hypothetical protein
MKLTCFIDTCSYINLTNFEFYKGTLLKLLYEKVNIRFCSEVNYEISRHYDPRMPDSLARSSGIYRPQKYTHPQYEKRIFDNNVKREDGNKGERDNFAAMLDFYLNHTNTNGIIFLSDDLKAIDVAFGEAITSFPICRIWNSFDSILFLLASHKNVTTDIAKTAIMQLDAFMATDDIKMDPVKTQSRIKRRQFYLKCAERINHVLFVKNV